ncbi:MAG: hypothetical protein [Microvirus sp.]|nr:MAG: hypothetical protein [Microvirus sp.]
MNQAQKAGVGAIIAVVLFTLPAVVELFGVKIPNWIPMIAQAVSMVAGIFGISVNLPSNTKKA